MNENLKFYLPYTGTLFIICGAIKLLVFYSLFNLDITPYLQLSEILTLFFSDILRFLAVFLILNVIFFLGMSKERDEKESTAIINSVNEKSFIKRLKSYGNYGLNIFTLAFGIIVGTIINYFTNRKLFWESLSLLGILLGSFLIKVIVLEIRRQFYIKTGEYPKYIYSYIIIIILIFVFFTIRTGYSNYDSIKNKKTTYGVKVELANKTITSDSNYYFIGKTNNYIYFYDEKREGCDIFPSSEVKSISYQKNRR